MAQQVGLQPLKAMRLLLDGGPYEGRLGLREFTPPVKEAREAWDVRLTPGKHLIQVEAHNGAVKGLSKTLEVSYVPKANTYERPNLYVLAIGVSRYQTAALNLNYAHRDAEELAATVQHYAPGLYQKVLVNVVTNEQATQRGIRKGLSWFREQMTQHDVGIVFYSGHGDKDRDGTFYMLPNDVEPTDLLTTGLPDSILKNLLQGVPGKKIMLLDCCHAGTAGADRKDPTKGGPGDRGRLGAGPGEHRIRGDHDVLVDGPGTVGRESSAPARVLYGGPAGRPVGSEGPGIHAVRRGPERGRRDRLEGAGRVRQQPGQGVDRRQAASGDGPSHDPAVSADEGQVIQAFRA